MRITAQDTATELVTPEDLDKVLALSIDEALEIALAHISDNELSSEWYEGLLGKLGETEQNAFTMGLATEGIKVQAKVAVDKFGMLQDYFKSLYAVQGCVYEQDYHDVMHGMTDAVIVKDINHWLVGCGLPLKPNKPKGDVTEVYKKKVTDQAKNPDVKKMMPGRARKKAQFFDDQGWNPIGPRSSPPREELYSVYIQDVETEKITYRNEMLDKAKAEADFEKLKTDIDEQTEVLFIVDDRDDVIKEFPEMENMGTYEVFDDASLKTDRAYVMKQGPHYYLQHEGEDRAARYEDLEEIQAFLDEYGFEKVSSRKRAQLKQTPLNLESDPDVHAWNLVRRNKITGEILDIASFQEREQAEEFFDVWVDSFAEGLYDIDTDSIVLQTKSGKVIKEYPEVAVESKRDTCASRTIQTVLDMIPKGKWTVQTGHWLIHQQLAEDFKDDEFLPPWKPPRDYKKGNAKRRSSLALQRDRRLLAQQGEMQLETIDGILIDVYPGEGKADAWYDSPDHWMDSDSELVQAELGPEWIEAEEGGMAGDGRYVVAWYKDEDTY